MKIRLLMYTAYFMAAVIFFFISACSSGDYAEEAWYGEAAMESEAPAPAMKRSEMDFAETLVMEDELTPEEAQPGGEQAKPEQNRKRIYNGSAGLVVEEPEKSRKKLEDLANESGGYVEQSYRDYLVLRVPAEQFHELFQRILGMGSIQYQSVDTWDVTDQYMDIQARLATAQATRDRLYVLLERSTDPEERARILREIGRLTEEIESIKQQIQILDSRIAFSRITVELIPRLQDDGTRGTIPFSWIASLTPLNPVSSELEARVTLNPGEDFAVFEKEEIYLAEDALGTSLSISTVENSPLGDSVFWQKALVHHLEGYYAEAVEKDLKFGDRTLAGAEFVSKDREPFRYFAGLVVDGKKLHIVEIFSPHADRDFSDLYKALEEGECK